MMNVRIQTSTSTKNSTVNAVGNLNLRLGLAVASPGGALVSVLTAPPPCARHRHDREPDPSSAHTPTGGERHRRLARAWPGQLSDSVRIAYVRPHPPGGDLIHFPATLAEWPQLPGRAIGRMNGG